MKAKHAFAMAFRWSLLDRLQRSPQTTTDNLPMLLSIRQAAKLLSVHPNTLRDWDRQGVLRAIRIGTRRDRRYPKKTIELWLQKRGSMAAHKCVLPKKKDALAAHSVRRVLGLPGFLSERNALGVSGLILVLVVCAQLLAPLGKAVAATGQQHNIDPSTCSGWANAEQAKHITTSAFSGADAFSKATSAFHEFIPSSRGSFGTAPRNDSLTCSGFTPSGLGPQDEADRGALSVALAGRASATSGDVLVPETSFDDGDTWHQQDAILLRGDISNALHGGYWKFSLPDGTTKQDLAHMQFRLRYVAEDTFTPSLVSVDGIALELQTKKIPAPASNGFFRKLFSITQEPSVLIDEKSLRGVELLDADGHVVNVTHVTELMQHGTKITFQRSVMLRPGTYIVRTTSTKFFRTVTSEQTFSYGLANLNLQKSTYKPGELAAFSMGAVDAQGKTVCNAPLTLRVRKPNGGLTTFKTGDRSITASSNCGAESITNQPDYSAHFVPDQAGVYTASLEVQTQQGPQSVEQRFTVSAFPATVVERLGPTRINPRARYVNELHVTPIADYRGPVDEIIPNGFIATDMSSGAKVLAATENQQIEWQVDWKSGTTYTLRYTFDAPNVSPALFQMGPLSFGTYTEPRQWSIASDEVVRKEIPNLAFASFSPRESDWATQHGSFAQSTAPAYLINENALIEVFKSGFTVPANSDLGLLDPTKPISVKDVSVQGPSGDDLAAYRASESFTRDAKEIEVLHLVPKRTFKPGQYTIVATLTDGTNTFDQRSTFLWGVLGIETQQSLVVSAHSVDLGIRFIDGQGHPVCSAAMDARITAPDGTVTTLQTQDHGKGIRTTSTCGASAPAKDDDYIASHLFKSAGDYTVTLSAALNGKPVEATETLHVASSLPMEVTRIAPVRVDPNTPFGVALQVVPQLDYTGDFTEQLPTSYAVTGIDNGGSIQPLDGDTQKIVWAVSWKKGKRYSLNYQFDPQQVTSALFQFGPVLANDFSESRQWHIAAASIAPTIPIVGQTYTATQKQLDGLSSFTKTAYKANEAPVLVIPKRKKHRGILANGDDNWQLRSLFIQDEAGEQIKLATRTSDVITNGDLQTNVTLETNAFHPGKQNVTLTMVAPDGSLQSIKKEILWGVVAVNVRRSVQPPNSSADLQIAVLDDYGSTVCDSDVDVTMTNPDGRQQQFSTATGTVSRNSTCAEHSVTNDPDYSAHFTTSVSGTYAVHVHASTKDGIRDVDDTFSVQNTVPFDVERTQFPTRTYPPASYPVSFTIIPKQDFSGTVTETLPASFEVSQMNENGIAGSTDATTKTVAWNVDWKKDQTSILSYTFKGPPISPMLFTLGPLTFTSLDGTVAFQETRQWQIASDATRTWDGGGGVDTNWSTATNWSSNIIPGSTDAVVFSSASSNNNSVWDTGVNSPSTVASITSTASYSGTLTMNRVVSTVSGAFNWASGGLTISSTNTLSVGGNFTLTTSGTFTANTSSVKMSGTSNTFNSAKTFSTINIDPSSAGTITNSTNAPTISAGLIVAASDTFSIDTSLNVILQSTATLSLAGTISGAGAVLYQNTVMNFPTTGTISSALVFNLSAGSMTIPERTYGGAIRCRNPSTTARICKLATATGKTLILLSDLQVEAVSTANATVDGATYDPILNITGNISYVGTGSGTEVIQAPDTGSVTWTVSGSVDFTNGTYTKGTEKLSMDGTSKTLTSASQSLYDFDVSTGSVTIADATTISDNLTVTSGTLTMGDAALTVTGTSSITGTLNTSTGSTGTRTFTGTVTVNSGGTWNLTGQNPATSFTNGITVSSGAVSFNNGTGATTFAVNAGNSQTLAGAVNMTFGGTATIGSSQTLTNNNTATVQFATITGADANATLATGLNSYTKVTAAPMTTGKIVPGTSANTFDYNYATATVVVPTTNNYYHLVLSSTGTVTMTSITGTTGDLTLSGSNTVTTSTSTFVVSGNLTVGTGTAFHMGDVANTVTGTTSITGTLDTATGATGTRTFTGNVTTNSGGTWDLTGQNPATSFAGDITVSTGAVKFDNGTGGATWTASKQLAGAVNMTFGGTSTINAGITLTNNNTGTVQFATIAGGDATSSLATGASSTTKVSSAAMATGTIVPSTSANTFEYNGATQTVKAPTTNPYYHLTLSGSGTVTMPASGLTAISGTLTISGTVSVTTASVLTITGDATVATGATFNINHDVTVNGGDITNAGTGIINTTSGTPTVTVAGTGSIGGVSGSTTFYNLTLSGTPTLAANIQVNNNLTLPASVTAGSTTVTMTGTSGTLVGGGSTIYALTIDPSSAGTVTLNTSNLTVSNTLTVASGDALTLNANRTLTLSANTGTSLSLSGTINGPGRLTYQNSATTFPTGGTLAATLITRFDTVNGNMVIPARTDYGAMEAFGDSANARTVTLGTAGSQTITTSGYFYVIADATGAGNNVTLQGATYDPTLNVGTDFDFTGTQAATEIVTAPDAAATWTVSGNVNLTDGTWTAGAETLVMNGSSKTLTSAGNTLFNVTLSGTITLANAIHTISGDLNMAGGTITAGTSTVAISGSGKTITGGSNTLYNLTLDGNGTTTLLTSGLTVSNTLNVTASDTLTLSAALTSSSTGTVTLGNSATLGGSSTLAVLNSNLSNNNSATLSAPVSFDATDLGTLTVPNRTFGGNVTLTSGSYGSVTTFTFGSATLQTLTFSGNLTLQDAANVGTVLDAASYNPTVNVTGNVTATAGGSPVFTIDMGSGTWTVTGNFSLANVTTFNNNSGTLVMNGASKTLTSNAKTLNNLTLSGSIILANATHTVAGNLDLTGGTITAGSSTVTMTGTSKTIDGGGATLNNLTISGTETLQNTDVTVSSSLTVDNLKSLTLNASRTLTLSANTGTSLSLSGTINGPGRLTYQNSATTFPTGGTLAATLITRFDTVNGNMVIPTRTDYGAIEAYGGSANARTVTLGTAGSQTITTSSYLYVIADAATPNHVTLQGATWDPTLNVGGDFDFTGTGSANEIVTAPDAAATWTVSGNVDLTSGTWTASAETLTMNGASKTLTSAGNALQHFAVSANSTTMVGTTTLNGNLTISGGTLTAPSSGALNVAGNWNNSGGTFTDNSSTVTFNGSSQQTAQGTMTGSSDFNNLIITNSSGSDPDTSPSVIFSAAATTAGTFTATTASTKIRFNASATYTFQNISFNGQATGTRVALRSSSGGTAWNLNVAGTRSVTYTDVKDSNACGQAPDIDATDGTNADGGGNSCWLTNTLSVSLSGNTAALGTLDTTHVNQAGIASTVTTNAPSGYVSLASYDQTLTSGTDTVDDTTGGTIVAGTEEFGAASSQSGNDIAQWSPTACSTTTSTSNATSLSTTPKSFASSGSSVSNQTTTLCLLASISVTTVPGSYTSTTTLVTTAKY